MQFCRAHLMLSLAVLLTVFCGCQRQDQGGGLIPEPARSEHSTQPLTVFAGAASKPALEVLVRQYQATSGKQVQVTFSGSGAVLAQFRQEQYGDVYVPGSDDFMDQAETQEAVQAETRTKLVYLVPVINVVQGNPKQVKGLADLARKDLRVVIGEPKSVCLGDIAKQVLQAEDLWDQVAPRLASYAPSCESVLQSLLLGEADLVIGWDVFARQHPDKVDALTLPVQHRRPRNIPAAVIRWSRQPEAARSFISYLSSPQAKRIWEDHGYTTRTLQGEPAVQQ